MLFIFSNFRNPILFSYLLLLSSFSPHLLCFSLLSLSISLSRLRSLSLSSSETQFLLLLLLLLNPFESMRIQPDSRYDCGTDTLDLGAIGFFGAVFFSTWQKPEPFSFMTLWDHCILTHFNTSMSMPTIQFKMKWAQKRSTNNTNLQSNLPKMRRKQLRIFYVRIWHKWRRCDTMKLEIRMKFDQFFFIVLVFDLGFEIHFFYTFSIDICTYDFGMCSCLRLLSVYLRFF